MIFSRIILFAICVLFVAGGIMWRFADAWDGIPLSRRAVLALVRSWRWWLVFSVAMLVRDAARYSQRGVPSDFVVLVIVLVMALGAYFGGKALGSTPE